LKFLVIGESCKDIFVYGDSNRLCPEAPAPVFNPRTYTENGGMSMNVVGNMKSLGVECDIHTNTNWEEVTKTRYVHQNHNYMFLRVDKNDKIKRVNDLKKIDFSKYDMVIISDYNKGFLHEEDIKYISDNHSRVFLDTKKLLNEAWCVNLEFIKINNYEYEKTKHTITNRLKEKLIITMGPEGCMFRGRKYPVPKVEIKDSSGAGDTFLSAFAIKFTETDNVNTAIAYANNCATQVVQKRGVIAYKEER